METLLFYLWLRPQGISGGILAGGILACLAAGLQWGSYPSIPCRFPGPHPGGSLKDLARGVSRPTPGGCPRTHLGGFQAHTWGVSRPTSRGSPGTHPGGVSQQALRQTPLPDGYCCGQYASSGMHSCFLSFFLIFDLLLRLSLGVNRSLVINNFKFNHFNIVKFSLETKIPIPKSSPTRSNWYKFFESVLFRFFLSSNFQFP